MRRDDATKLLRAELDQHNLRDWHIRSVDLVKEGYLGLCQYSTKTIMLNTFHIDLHSDKEIINTIKHEVAHALTPDHGHDEIWAAKAREIGCDNTAVVCSIGLPASIIEAQRSNRVIEVITEEETVRKVNYRVTRLQDKCPTCGKVAKELKTLEIGWKKITFLECGHSIVKDIPKPTAFDTIVFDGEIDCKHEWPEKKIWDGSMVRGTVCAKCNAKRPFMFQVEGMRFLEKALGRGGVFDEQGLGKTIQSLGYIKFHPETLPFLWVCKSGLKYQAMKEIVRILGMDYFPYMLNTGKDHIFPGFKAYICSFDIFRRMSPEKFAQLNSIVKCIVIDEVQHIKNPDSSRTQEVRKLCKDKEFVIPLSGTPWKNRGSEFYVVLNLIDKAKFYSFERFKQNWVHYYTDSSTGKTKEGGLRRIPEFKEFTKDIIIRRERAEVMKELPLINRVKLNCQLPKAANEAYDDAVDSFVKIWNQLVIGGDEDSFGGSQAVLTALNTMRQIVGIAKIPATLEQAKEFLENTEDEKRKLVIFVHHIAVAHEIYSQMKEYAAVRTADDFEAINVVKISSDMSSEARFIVQEQFNSDPNTRIMIASTLAAGEGLNLQTCSDCIIHERQWNPANEEQAEGRFIRIGQTAKNVNAIYVHADNTVDTDFDQIVDRKRLQFHAGMNKGEMPQWNAASLVRELGDAIASRWKMRGKK